MKKADPRRLDVITVQYWGGGGAHIMCEYRLAPGAILHAGTERAGLRV